MNSMYAKSQSISIDLSKLNTSKVTDMQEMFSSTKAVEINVSNLDTSNVTNMAGMFGSSQVTTLDLSSFNTSKVTNMSGMFAYSQLEELDLSNFNTSKVTTMASMFRYSQVITLNLSSFDTSNVRSMKGMFGNSQVMILDLSNFDTSNVTNMNSMFKNSNAVTLNLTSFNIDNVTDMSYMFSEMKYISSLDLTSFDFQNYPKLLDLFVNDTNLTTVYVNQDLPTSDNIFSGCTSIIGGEGTKYIEGTSYSYTIIDKGEVNPGYLTDGSTIAEPNLFSTDSWESIAKAASSGNIYKYKVGDTKTITLENNKTYTIRIANTSLPSECSTSVFSQTACGFVLEFADIIATHNMNPAGTYNGTTYNYGWNKDGWPVTSMRTFVNINTYDALPSKLQNVIINTTVVSSHGSEDTDNFTSTDKLYLLAPKEIYTDFSNNYDTAKYLTRTLDYYTAQGVTTSNYSGAIKKNGTSADYWWLRSASSTNNRFFYAVNSGGSWASTSAGTTYGVAPAFRLG